jgi:hypothetical protein
MRPSGLTLLELLIGVVLGGVAVASAASVMVSHLNSTNATTWAVQLQRDFTRFNSLLTSEAREACLMERGTPRVPSSSPICRRRTFAGSTSCAVFSGPSTTFSLITPVDYVQNLSWTDYLKLDPPVEVVTTYTYNSATRQVLRRGPDIYPDGRIAPIVYSYNEAETILDNVTAFTPIVTADCRSATITVTLAVPTYPITRTQTITVAANAAHYIP